MRHTVISLAPISHDVKSLIFLVIACVVVYLVFRGDADDVYWR